MKRKVLILKGYSKNDIELTYDRQIIELYKKYFSSKAGGVYNIRNEILVLEEPTLQQLKKNDDEINSLDVLIIVLLGHGANIDGKQIFQLQKNLLINPGQLQYNVNKQLFIIESCRNIIDINIEIANLNGLIPKFKFGGIIRKQKSISEAKNTYNNEISKIENETTYLFASNIGESAENYFFINNLIKISREIHENSQNKVHVIKDIFNLTAHTVIALTGGRQNPIIEGNGSFPFVVSII